VPQKGTKSTKVFSSFRLCFLYPEERIEAVWTLTELCMAWNKPSASEPRLQGTVTRLQRAQRLEES
jgi:hypothetical protein